MSGSSSALVGSLIAEQASDHDAAVLAWQGAVLVVSLRLTRPSGRTATFLLRIDTAVSDPTVREDVPTRLPASCPNRHINGDGSFCMSFPAEDRLIVTDPAAATTWWRRLLKFLDLQEMAERLRRWPTTHEWAHGPEAAWHQARAERSAAALGERFVHGLADRRLKALRRRRGSSFIELHEDGARLYSVWETPRRVATLRQACLCGSGHPIIACGDHAEHAATLPLALMAMERSEAAFWRAVGDKPCCGKLRDCPLRQPAAHVPLAQAA